MAYNSNRRNWLKQSTLAAMGLGFSMRSMAGEDYLPFRFDANPALLNLGSNENPYGISALAREAIKEVMPYANRYSSNAPLVKPFRQELAAYYGVQADQVLITAGSGEGLKLLARHYSNGTIVTATPTFGILPATAKRIGTKVVEIPLTDDKVHDLPAMLKAVTNETSLVYVVNPANPTGTVVHPDTLKQFCQEASKKAVVLIDEAYIDFLNPPYNVSMISLVHSNPNIIVMGTFSKIHGMAGLRTGYIFAHATTIAKLEDSYFDNTQYAVSNLSQYAAMASLKDPAHREMTKEKNAAARQYTYDVLSGMRFRCIPSFTNFMFFKLDDYPGDFANDMLQKSVILRSNTYPDGKWARVSFSTMDDMRQFAGIMKQVFPGR